MVNDISLTKIIISYRLTKSVIGEHWTGISGKLRKAHVAPIVVISTPEREVETPSSHPTTTIDPVSEVEPTTTRTQLPNKHSKQWYRKERRPSIVNRNFRKIFGK